MFKFPVFVRGRSDVTSSTQQAAPKKSLVQMVAERTPAHSAVMMRSSNSVLGDPTDDDPHNNEDDDRLDEDHATATGRALLSSSSSILGEGPSDLLNSRSNKKRPRSSWVPADLPHPALASAEVLESLQGLQSIVSSPGCPPPFLTPAELLGATWTMPSRTPNPSSVFPEGLLRIQQYGCPLLLRGESTLLVGPSGCGKRTALWYSTALHILQVKMMMNRKPQQQRETPPVVEQKQQTGGGGSDGLKDDDENRGNAPPSSSVEHGGDNNAAALSITDENNSRAETTGAPDVATASATSATTPMPTQHPSLAAKKEKALFVVSSVDEGRRTRRLIEHYFPGLVVSTLSSDMARADIVLLTSLALQDLLPQLLRNAAAESNNNNNNNSEGFTEDEVASPSAGTTASHDDCNVAQKKDDGTASTAVVGASEGRRRTGTAAEDVRAWNSVTRLIAFCAERFTVPPLVHHLSVSWWCQLLSVLDPDCAVSMSCACHHRDVVALMSQLRLPDVKQVQLLDYAAWTDVLHRVYCTEESLKLPFLVELLSSPHHRPAVVLVATKAEANTVADGLRAALPSMNHAAAISTNSRSFYEGVGDVLVTTDWLFMEGIELQRSVSFVVNYTLPRRNLEETLATRVRMLFSPLARNRVCCAVTLVNAQGTAPALCARLKELLETTLQEVPSFLYELGAASSSFNARLY